MSRKFNERYRNLINEDVPKRFMRAFDGRHGHLTQQDHGKMLHDYDETHFPPENGFVSHYCGEN